MACPRRPRSGMLMFASPKEPHSSPPGFCRPTNPPPCGRRSTPASSAPASRGSTCSTCTSGINRHSGRTPSPRGGASSPTGCSARRLQPARRRVPHQQVSWRRPGGHAVRSYPGPPGGLLHPDRTGAPGAADGDRRADRIHPRRTRPRLGRASPGGFPRTRRRPLSRADRPRRRRPGQGSPRHTRRARRRPHVNRAASHGELQPVGISFRCAARARSGPRVFR